VARKAGRKSPGFIDSVRNLITDFYGTVVQDLTPWTPKAPKIVRHTEPAADRLTVRGEGPELVFSTVAPSDLPGGPSHDAPRAERSAWVDDAPAIPTEPSEASPS